MFSFAARTFARRAPYVAAMAGGAVVTIPTYQQIIHCKESSMPRTKSERKEVYQVSSLRKTSRRGNETGYSVDMAKTLVKIFHAENTVEGKIDMRKELSFDQAKHMLIAAGAKPKEWKGIFDAIDMDDSKSIEFIELISFLLACSTGTLRDKASLFFYACDANDSQSIEATDLKEVVHQMMLSRNDAGFTSNFVEANPILCAGIPESYVAHMRANQMVNDILTNASTNGKTVSEKEFQTWLIRGGKQVNQLCTLFGI